MPFVTGSLEDSAKKLAAQGKEAVQAGVNEAKTLTPVLKGLTYTTVIRFNKFCYR